MAQERRSILQSELKRLCLASGGFCSYRDPSTRNWCDRRVLFNPDSGPKDVNFSEIAHIVGPFPESPRHRKLEDEKAYYSADNLVILCVDHHIVVDDKSRLHIYTEENVRRMKRDHEARVNQATLPSTDRAPKIARTTIRLPFDKQVERVWRRIETVSKYGRTDVLPLADITGEVDGSFMADTNAIEFYTVLAHLQANARIQILETTDDERVLVTETGRLLPYNVRFQVLPRPRIEPFLVDMTDTGPGSIHDAMKGMIPNAPDWNDIIPGPPSDRDSPFSRDHD